MNDRLLPGLFILLVFAYGSYLAAVRAWGEPQPFLFGAIVGFFLAYGYHLFKSRAWKERERAFQDYASYVAKTVSLVYLRHAPCPKCGKSPSDEYADGFGTHSPFCTILNEIMEFGGPDQSPER